MIRIETERLHLRNFSPSDLAAYHKIMSQDAVGKQLPRGRGYSLEETEKTLNHFLTAYQEHGYGPLAVLKKEDNCLIGHCGLGVVEELAQVEVLYALGEEYWGKGFASEAAMASVSWGFIHLDLNEIIGLTKLDNYPSQNVLRKCGLKEVGKVDLWGLELIKFLIKK